MKEEWKKQLKEAKDLFDEGLIEKAEYDQMRAEAFALRKVPKQSRDEGGDGESVAWILFRLLLMFALLYVLILFLLMMGSGLSHWVVQSYG
tara:strand:- start:3353 stop:3625 length:273 start_codon:yes stop_codon:yes gene_type:complete